MLDSILNNKDFKKHLTSYDTGQILFLEGDDSQDLYILVSGRLDVLKGDMKISEMNRKGSLFGEMSFLLGARRTASIRAASEVEVIRIPKEELPTILSEFPEISKEISRHLAERLDETSQVLYGLHEISDQLPDAVIMTDREGEIISWNRAAENVYGWGWHEMHHKSVEEIYEDPEEYKRFIDEVQERSSVREKVLKVKHPEMGTRFISTSTTLLYDGHHNCQGVLSLGRDVTSAQNMERRYRRIRNWLLPAFILIVALTVGLFFGYPHLFRDQRVLSMKQQELKNQLAKDYLMLKSLLAQPLGQGDRSKTTLVMKEFFDIQDASETPYIGLVLLDKDRKVVNAYSTGKGAEAETMIGSSYGGIAFKGNKNTIHRILSLYRTDRDHPMGRKGIEIAFELKKDNEVMGWLLFRMDMDKLKKTYDLDGEDLRRFRIRKP